MGFATSSTIIKNFYKGGIKHETQIFQGVVSCVTVLPYLRGGVHASVVTQYSLSNGKVGEYYSAYNFMIDGYVPKSISMISGQLPDGVEWWGAGDGFSGIPVKSGSFTFQLQVEPYGWFSTNSQTTRVSYTIRILPNPDIVRPTIDGNFTDGTINEPYSSDIRALNSSVKGTCEWSYTGKIPDGLSLNVNTTSKDIYELSGTPTKEGTYEFTVSLWDMYEPENGRETKDFTITIGSNTPESEPEPTPDSEPSTPTPAPILETPETPSTQNTPQDTPTTGTPTSETNSTPTSNTGSSSGSGGGCDTGFATLGLIMLAAMVSKRLK